MTLSKLIRQIPQAFLEPFIHLYAYNLWEEFATKTAQLKQLLGKSPRRGSADEWRYTILELVETYYRIAFDIRSAYAEGQLHQLTREITFRKTFKTLKETLAHIDQSFKPQPSPQQSKISWRNPKEGWRQWQWQRRIGFYQKGLGELESFLTTSLPSDTIILPRF